MSPIQFLVSSEYRLWLFGVAVHFADEPRWFALLLYAVGAYFLARYAVLWHTARRQAHGPQTPGWVRVAMGPMPGFYAAHFLLVAAFMTLLWAAHPLIPLS